LPVGTNPARAFGLDARDRACRLATNAGFDCADASEASRATLVANLDYAWDPAWLKAMAARPRTVLTFGGKAVLAHVPAGEDAGDVARAVADGAAPDGYELLAAETAKLSYAELRKRDRPFVMRLDADDPEPVERAASDAVPLAQARFLLDPLGGPGRPQPQFHHRGRRDPVRARFRLLLAR